MRIFFVVPFAGVGGGETQTRILAEGMLARGVEVAFIFRGGSPYGEGLADWSKSRGVYVGGPYEDSKEFRRQCIAWAGSWSPDWILTHDCERELSALQACYKIPTLWQQHTVFPARVDQASRVKATKIVCVSRANRRVLVEKYPFLSPRTVAISNGVPLTFGFGVESRREEWGIASEGPVAAWVGRFDEAKGTDLVAKAVRDCGVVGIIGGRGDGMRYTQRVLRIQSKPERIRYFTEGVDSAEVFASCDFAVLPTRAEGGVFYSCMEAMVMGKPVITTRVADLPEVFEDGRDLLFCDYNAESVKQAMLRAVELGEVGRRRMGLAARRKIYEHYNEDAMVEKYLEVMS